MKVLFLGYDDCLVLSFLQLTHDVVQTMKPVKDRVLERFDLTISFGYRYVLRPQALALAPRPPINLHIAFLPWNRGADPNYWSFCNDTPKGVTIHEMDERIDSGPIIYRRLVRFSLDENTLASTYQRLMNEIQDLFFVNWNRIRDRTYHLVKSMSEGSYHNVGEMPELPEGWDTEVKTIKRKEK